MPATRCRSRRTMRPVLAPPSPRPTSRRTSGTSSTRPGNGRVSSFHHRHQFIISGVYQLPLFEGDRGLKGDCRRLARQRDFHRAVGRALHGEPERGSRQHRHRPGAASRPGWRSELAGRRADARALVQCRRVRASGAIHLRQRAAQQRHGPGYANFDFALAKNLMPERLAQPGVPMGRSSTCSTARTSTSRTVSSATPISGASSAPRVPREMQFGLRFAF